MSDLKLRDACIHGHWDEHTYIDEEAGLICHCPGGRDITIVEGIVTAVGVNTMADHGEQGPWAHVTIYGDYEPFDTMLVAAIEDTKNE